MGIIIHALHITHMLHPADNKSKLHEREVSLYIIYTEAMASKEDISMSECKDALPNNVAAAKDDVSTDKNEGPINNEDKYEEIRKAAASLTPKSRRKIDAVLTEIETTTPARSISILLTGITHSGKSTLTNAILGLKVDDDRAAKEDGSIKARCTTEVTMYRQNRNGVSITVWDSSGLQDGTTDQDQYLQQIKLKCSQPDLTMYCIKITERRFVRGHENPDVVAMEKLTKEFGSKFWKNTIIVLTYANIPYMLDQRPLLYKGRTQIVASLASKMKHLVAALK